MPRLLAMLLTFAARTIALSPAPEGFWIKGV